MPRLRTGLAGSPGQFVGEPLANVGPVLADGFSCQRPPRPALELLRPEGPNRRRVVRGGRIEASQQLSHYIGAIFLGQRKRLSNKSRSLVGHDSTLQAETCLLEALAPGRRQRGR
jgi:hypothetical protein